MSRVADETMEKASAVEGRSSRGGLLYGLSAYTIWGFIPLYFRAVSEVPPVIVLCHRIVWSALFLGLVVSFRREWKLVWPVMGTRRNVVLLVAGAVLIALNWLIFIYAVTSRQLLQASLGYFINPLLSVALGMIFLRERLRGWQWLAVGIAGAAVVNLAIRRTGSPWVAVSLAGTFGLYGLVRKKLDVNSLHGLLVESGILLPFAVVVLGGAQTGLTGLTGPTTEISAATKGILSLSGIITAVPLLCFGAAVRRLRLSTMGFLQYVGPTLQFVVALCFFREVLDPAKLGSFILCWLAIGVYVVDSWVRGGPAEVADEPE